RPMAPVVDVFNARARALGRYRSSRAARKMRSRVSGRMASPSRLLSTRDTVETWTSARAATSSRRGVRPWLGDMIRRSYRRCARCANVCAVAPEISVLGWDHPRCTKPLTAAKAAWEARTGDTVKLAFRTLEEFGDQPIEDAAGAHDVLFY